MPKNKKQFVDYQDYLKSTEWKNLKLAFYKNYNGYNNVCEISGKTIQGDDSEYMCLHHWKYSKDWNDDNIDNLILVCSSVHEWIHEYGIIVGEEISKEAETRDKCKCDIISLYIDSDPYGFETEGYNRGNENAVINLNNEANTKAKKLIELIDRRDNHIDYLISDVESLRAEVKKLENNAPLKQPMI